MTFQCSVLSDSGTKTCPEEHNVVWFRSGSGQSRPSLMYAHGTSAGECGKSPESRSPPSCVYSFSKEVNSSDAGAYYCAVAACGGIFLGNETKLEGKSISQSW